MGIIISGEEETAGQRGQAICQKAKRKQNCFSSMGALRRHHRLLLQRRMPRCWEVGVRGHTASWGRAGSQQTWCLPPSRPHGPLPGTEAPSPGKETPWLGPSPLCGSKLPILPPGPAGLRSGAWSSPATLMCPCRAPGGQSGFRRPEDAGSSAPGSPPPGPPRAAWRRSRALGRGRTRMCPLLLAQSQAPAAPLRCRPWGPSPPPRSKASPEQPRERPQALKLGSRLRPELSALPAQRSQRCFVTRTIPWGVEPSLGFHGRASRLQPSLRMRIKNTTRLSQHHR